MPTHRGDLMTIHYKYADLIAYLTKEMICFEVTWDSEMDLLVIFWQASVKYEAAYGCDYTLLQVRICNDQTEDNLSELHHD